MIERQKKRLVKRKPAGSAFRSMLAAIAVLALLPMASNAGETSSPVPADEAARSGPADKPLPKGKAADYTVEVDNSQGLDQLHFDMEKSECMSNAGPASFTVEPGKTKTFTITDQNAAATTCFGGAKRVVWQVNTFGSNGGTVYTIDFIHRNNGFFLSKWQTTIATTTGHPGMPVSATCGRTPCLNAWADQEGNSSITVTYGKDD